MMDLEFGPVFDPGDHVEWNVDHLSAELTHQFGDGPFIVEAYVTRTNWGLTRRMIKLEGIPDEWFNTLYFSKIDTKTWACKPCQRTVVHKEAVVCRVCYLPMQEAQP